MDQLDDHRRANLAVVERIFAAIGNSDADAQVANYTNDIVIEFPYTDPPGEKRGRQLIRDYLAGAFSVFQFTLEITDVHATTNPDKLIVEFAGRGTYLPNGAPYENTYIAVFEFRDGLVFRQREFFNPLMAAKSRDA